MENSYPQISWNGKWHYICHAGFLENRLGVNLFCSRLVRRSNEIGSYLNDTEVDKVTNKIKTYDSDSFLIGKCEASDTLETWPTCSGRCNAKKVGASCYKTKKDGTQKDVSRCHGDDNVRFNITCEGLPAGNQTRYSTCWGKG